VSSSVLERAEDVEQRQAASAAEADRVRRQWRKCGHGILGDAETDSEGLAAGEKCGPLGGDLGRSPSAEKNEFIACIVAWFGEFWAVFLKSKGEPVFSRSMCNSPKVSLLRLSADSGAVGWLLTLAAHPRKVVPYRLAGVVEICRPVNNPPAGEITLA